MSIASHTRSQRAKEVNPPDKENTSAPEDKDIEDTGNTQTSEILAKSIKSLRFKRNIAAKMISRYDEATRKIMEQNGSRTAMKKHLHDILDHLDTVEKIHAQIEEKLGEDEELIEDTMLLADTRILVNNITGLIQEHIESRASEPPTRNNSVIGSRCGNDELEIQNENREDGSEVQPKYQHPEPHPCQASDITNDKRVSKQDVPPCEMELSGQEKAALYVQHLENTADQGSTSVGKAEPEDWIINFYHTREITARSVDPGKIPIRADVPIYNGDPLRWLTWSGLFKALVHDTKMSSEAKMGFLHTKLTNECDRVIAGLFPDEDGYAEALLLLRDRYGHPTTLQAAHLQILKTLSPVKVDHSNLANSFQAFVDQARSHLAVLRRYSKGESPFVSSLIHELTDKLPQEDAKAWRTKIQEAKVKMTLKEFSEWLGARGRAYWGALSPNVINQRKDPGNHYRPRRSFHGQQVVKCEKCGEKHKTESCEKLKQMSVEERFNFVRENRLCFNCLERSHISRNCPKKRVCGKDDCKKKHHQLLHQEENARSTTTKKQASSVAFGVAEVSVVGAGGQQVKGKLLLDDGSDTTLVSDSFVKKLGLRGKKTLLNISGVGGNENKIPSQQLTLKVKTPEGDTEFVSLNARSLPKICDPIEAVPWSNIKSKWKHLDDIDLNEIGGEIDILLGLDHAHLLVPLEIRTGKPQEPVAKKMSFGWTAVGPIGKSSKGAHTYRVTRVESDTETLDVAFKQFWDSESFGTKDTNYPAYTKDEQQAIDTLKHDTKRLDTGYEVPLLWKEDEPSLENNRQIAERRLDSLQKRFNKDPVLEKDYREAVNKYLESGYAHKVTDEEDLHGPNQWYLPHHGVYKRSATERKIRVVFDASAKFKGKCLNDMLLPGPVLQNELPQVLTKFREGDIGYGADIEGMFSQVRVQEKDARYHRFLWKDKGSDSVDTYQMDRLTFGDTCSPFEAIYVTRRTAEDFGNGNEEAVKAINENLYVDDYLDSTETDEQAIQRGQDVSEILANGDFHLRKWISNSPSVTAALGDNTQTETLKDLVQQEPCSKILGVKWNIREDTLTFSVETVESVTYTRRGLLSKLASIFDPLGLASPFTIKAKILTQQLCLLGLDWDDPIPASQKNKWYDWLKKLPELATIGVPRCVQPRKRNVVKSELHTFCDASVEAFAAVAYLRSIYDDNQVVCSFLMAKTKVAPKKALSVARLELQAALLGARLANYVKKALRIPIDTCTFWTDSKCALGWIRSTAVWYKPFVAHRVGEIQTLSDPKSWRHVPGLLNVSDCATRSKPENKAPVIPDRWFRGPDFLYQDESDWPAEVRSDDLQPNEEIKPSVVFISMVTPSSFYADVNLERCSTLWKAQRIAAQVNRLFAIPKGNKPKSSYLTVPELRLGLTSLIRQCQREAFTDDLASLEKEKRVSECSHLLSFTPFLDGDKVIRVGGRLERAKMPYEVRHPIILPQKHRLTELIIEQYHCLENHGGVDHVLASIRQRFWIIRGRQEVKRIKGKCISCKREKAKTGHQLLSELPVERLTPFQPAFYHTSVDYFGPYNVCLTRNTTAKRYGVLFACMTTRCVHLELAESLSTPDFLQALHKMMARRGQPRSLYSDNGTNFIGAKAELKLMVKDLNKREDIKDRLARIGEGITWKLQPPASPHWGGVHESLVKSVKTALHPLWNL